MKSIGQRVRYVRTEKGLTLEELARRAGISKSFLWAVENDKSNISGVHLLQVANVLGASVDYLLKGGEGGPPCSTDAPIEISQELKEAAEELHLSFRDTHTLLQAHQAILARRGGKEVETKMTTEKWKKLWAGIKDIVTREAR